MSKPTINPELNWERFPNAEEGVLSRFNGYQTVVLAKIPKAIDEDFNENGIYFGMISNADLDYDGISFTTSYWDGCQDCYFPDEIYTKNSTYARKEEYSRFNPVTWSVTLEDITEFVVIERVKV